jgi:hypothetical protein
MKVDIEEGEKRRRPKRVRGEEAAGFSVTMNKELLKKLDNAIAERRFGFVNRSMAVEFCVAQVLHLEEKFVEDGYLDRMIEFLDLLRWHPEVSETIGALLRSIKRVRGT